MRNPARVIALAALVIAVVAPAALAQLPLFDTPRVSPAASVTQRVGITDITVDYHRPSVREREIWGGLVPYGEVWRAGANENTTITFTDPVTIDDTTIDPGTYGLHVIPEEGEWTFILSYQARAWGSFSYDEAEDAVRITATPIEIPYQEYMTYTFDKPTRNEVQLTLSWENLSASFPIWVDTDEVVFQYLKDELRGLARFSWRGWQQASSWLVQNDVHLDTALGWIDQSIRMNPNFTNMTVKADLLRKQGDVDGADDLMKLAMEAATETELNAYGYRLIGQNRLDEAIDIFEMNVEQNPDSWNAYDSLAEAYMRNGDTKKAIENYEKALSMVEDDAQKARIRGQLSQLKG